MLYFCLDKRLQPGLFWHSVILPVKTNNNSDLYRYVKVESVKVKVPPNVVEKKYADKKYIYSTSTLKL